METFCTSTCTCTLSILVHLHQGCGTYLTTPPTSTPIDAHKITSIQIPKMVHVNYWALILPKQIHVHFWWVNAEPAFSHKIYQFHNFAPNSSNASIGLYASCLYKFFKKHYWSVHSCYGNKSCVPTKGKKRYHNENHQRFRFCYVLYVHVHVHYLIINSWNWNEKVHLSLLSLCVHTSILCPVWVV